MVYGRYLKRISNQTQEAVGDMSKVAQESLHSLRTVQAFGGYPTEETKFDAKVNSVVELNRKEAWASAVFFGGWHGNLVDQVIDPLSTIRIDWLGWKRDDSHVAGIWRHFGLKRRNFGR